MTNLGSSNYVHYFNVDIKRKKQNVSFTDEGNNRKY
jgi:hypothetical protein